jgi:hypothetical protein
VRPAHLLLVVVSALACGGGAARPAATGPAAFEWGVSQGLWGEEQLTIAADGEAHYRFQSVRGRPAIERRRRLSPADLEPLRRATSDPAFCQLRSGRAGIPDEGKPTLAVGTGPRPCTVTLLDGEWEEVAAARPARDAIRAIIDRMKRE